MKPKERAGKPKKGNKGSSSSSHDRALDKGAIMVDDFGLLMPGW
jgi:hypothetical protein